jgi:hypothetical protein
MQNPLITPRSAEPLSFVPSYSNKSSVAFAQDFKGIIVAGRLQLKVEPTELFCISLWSEGLVSWPGTAGELFYLKGMNYRAAMTTLCQIRDDNEKVKEFHYTTISFVLTQPLRPTSLL